MTVTMLRRAVSRFLRPGGWALFTWEGPGAVVSGQWGGASLVVANNYASVSKKTREFPSQLDDLSPTMLKKDYKDLEIMNMTNDVVRKLLSLEMATHKEKLKLKTSQLVEKVQRSPSDVGSTEVQIAILTAKIRNYQEHLQVHRKVFQELQKLRAAKQLKQKAAIAEKAQSVNKEVNEGAPV
ncbi:small ribosomal subunit protein uS15m isoform X2 [Stegostoma tigrinum]|uniref:small ribosomal subunit protein uS15m isoform X2 n=1 Tax=Stegostoma tigrinum TaxID=3053191 RepID=UPI00202B9557|nr:small ribosomal subunit protein uS15m isoform X2 [Stegostoma tigrinum]